MSTADTKALIEEAVAAIQKEVPALAAAQARRSSSSCAAAATSSSSASRSPGPKITRDIASDAKVRLSVPRSHFNELAKEGKIRHWREAFESGHVKATGPVEILKLIQSVVERQEERSPHAQAAHEVSAGAADAGGVGAARAHASSAGRPRETMWEERFDARQGRARRGRQRDRRLRAGHAGRRPRRRRPRRAPPCAATSTSSRSRSTTRGRATPARSSSRGDGRRAGVHFGFNAWGEKFRPYDDDARVRRARARAPGGGAHRRARPVLEGGSIAVDGEGTLITTEQCLLHPSRNPALDREQIEARLRETLGVERVVWLGLGPRRGRRHRRPRRQHLRLDRARPRAAADRRRRGRPQLRALPRERRAAARRPGSRSSSSTCCRALDHDGPPTVVPYVNYYVCQRRADRAGHGRRDRRRRRSRCSSALYPGREAVPVPAPRSPSAAAGVHCITQQVPAPALGQLFGGRPVEDLVHARDLERALEAAVARDERELRARAPRRGGGRSAACAGRSSR